MGERLSAGNVALALLANSLATGAALTGLILTFGPISGAHFNPAVSVADASQRGLRRGEALIYVLAQFLGAFAGVGVADVPMFWAAQLTGAATATLLFRWLVPSLPESAPQVVLPHAQD